MDKNKIAETMEQYVRDNEMAGGCLIVRRFGEVIYKDKWGYINVVSRKPVEYDTIFKMASWTKTVTAVAVLMLIEDGKIGLDDELTRFIPEFEDLKVVSDKRYILDSPEQFDFKKLPMLLLTFDPAKIQTSPAERMVTIRDLLTHSSGIEMGLAGLLRTMKMKCKDDTLEKRALRYTDYALDFQPGTATGYSALAGFDILARIVEIASGREFSDFVKTEIFLPLEMKDSFYHPDEVHKERIPPLYKTHKGKHKDVTGSKEDVNGIGKIGPAYNSGSAGLYSTIMDMDRFASMLAGEGSFNRVRILKADTVRMINSVHAYKELESSPGMVWGLGMIVRKDPVKAGISVTRNAYGWSGAFGTHMVISPEDGISFVFAMNRSNIGGSGSPISRKLEELVFDKGVNDESN